MCLLYAGIDLVDGTKVYSFGFGRVKKPKLFLELEYRSDPTAISYRGFYIAAVFSFLTAAQ
jgi:hypothetical protein